MSELRFPLAQDPKEDESGLGYVLRMAGLNQTDLHGVGRAMGMTSMAQFTSKHADQLAVLFHQDPAWLKRSLRGVLPPKGCYGHAFPLRNMLRGKHPQVCPSCILTHGYCRDSWDLTMSCLCVHCKSWLIDRCPQCFKPLRWYRPGLDIGHCRHVLANGNSDSRPDAEALHFQSMVDASLHQLPMARWTDKLGLPDFMGSLSLYGLWSVVQAFGAAILSAQSVTNTEWRKIPGVGQVRALEKRALIRLRMWATEKSGCWIDQVARTPLIRLYFRPVNAQDRQVAALLLKEALGEDLSDSVFSKFPELRQMTLF